MRDCAWHDVPASTATSQSGGQARSPSCNFSPRPDTSAFPADGDASGPPSSNGAGSSPAAPQQPPQQQQPAAKRAGGGGAGAASSIAGAAAALLGLVGGLTLLACGGYLLRQPIKAFLEFFITAVEEWGIWGYVAYALVYAGLEVRALPGVAPGRRAGPRPLQGLGLGGGSAAHGLMLAALLAAGAAAMHKGGRVRTSCRRWPAGQAMGQTLGANL
jgi:hypothetical protein